MRRSTQEINIEHNNIKTLILKQSRDYSIYDITVLYYGRKDMQKFYGGYGHVSRVNQDLINEKKVKFVGKVKSDSPGGDKSLFRVVKK